MNSVRDAIKNLPPLDAQYEEKKDEDEEIIEQIKEKLDPKGPAVIDKDALAKQLMDPKYC